MQKICPNLKIGATREKTSPVSVLGNRAGTRGVGTGLRAVSAACIIHDVP